MAMEILKSFGTLQSELEQARTSLKGVDENIKRLIGRDPSEIVVPQRHLKRQISALNGGGEGGAKHRWGNTGGNRRVFTNDADEPVAKRRGGVFNRLSERVVSERVPHNHHHQDEEALDYKGGHRQMISKVIVTPKEIPSRQEALDAQSGDEKFKARNRRMFGALLGTLQKFQQEETKLKPKEEKRAQLEKKIEEIEIREKAEIKKERQELFMNRKRKQAEIKMIELKMQKMKAYAHWEALQKSRMNYILSKAKPSIHYLPKRLNEANKLALEESKKAIEKLIEDRRQEVLAELQVIEDKMKWNHKGKQITTNESDKGSDADNDDEIMKDDQESKRNSEDNSMAPVKEEDEDVDDEADADAHEAHDSLSTTHNDDDHEMEDTSTKGADATD